MTRRKVDAISVQSQVQASCSRLCVRGINPGHRLAPIDSKQYVLQDSELTYLPLDASISLMIVAGICGCDHHVPNQRSLPEQSPARQFMSSHREILFPRL